MAGIYIANEQMPRSCYDCPYKCSGIKGKLMVPVNGRLSDCPITFVHDHGRLVDAWLVRDAILKYWLDLAEESFWYKRGMEDAYECVRNSPTIIPADKTGD